MGTTIATTRRRALRRGAVAAGVGGLLAAATGCGQESGSPATAAPARDARANLVWLIWSSNTTVRGEAYNNIVSAFQQQYPNVTVEQISGGGNLKLTLE